MRWASIQCKARRATRCVRSGCLIVVLFGCSAGRSSESSGSTVYVRVDRALISNDRRSLTIEAGADPPGYCMSGDAGVTALVQDGVLVVAVARMVAPHPPPTCPARCAISRSVVALQPPLGEEITLVRSADGSVPTCSSLALGDNATADVPLVPCVSAAPTAAPVTPLVGTTLPSHGSSTAPPC
jgi:hypothetical protein